MRKVIPLVLLAYVLGIVSFMLHARMIAYDIRNQNAFSECLVERWEAAGLLGGSLD